MLRKVISGAQNGADIAGLKVAKKHGFETGGIMPFGYKTLDGPKPEYKEEFGVHVHNSSSYVPRTRANVRDSDGTIRFAFNFDSRGEVCTLKAIKDYDRPHLDVDLNDPISVEKIVEWLVVNKIEVLNVAGNSETTHVGTEAATTPILDEVLRIAKSME
jgi:hypothetical protein